MRVKVYVVVVSNPSEYDDSADYDTFAGVFPTREAAVESAVKGGYVVVENWPDKPVPFANIVEQVVEGVTLL